MAAILSIVLIGVDIVSGQKLGLALVFLFFLIMSIVAYIMYFGLRKLSAWLSSQLDNNFKFEF
jgi:hypothetical protein